MNRGLLLRPILTCTEVFPRLSENFVWGKVQWLMAQNVPVHVLDRHEARRQYDCVSSSWQRLFKERSSSLYPGSNHLIRGIKRFNAVMQAWGYGLTRHPVSILRYQKTAYDLPEPWSLQPESRKTIANQNIDRFLLLYHALRLKPQWVHVHFGENALDWLPVKQILKERLPLMVSFWGRDLMLDIRDNPELYEMLFRLGDGFLTPSRFLYEQALALGCPAEKLQVHPVEVDTDVFCPSPEASMAREKPVIVSAVPLTWENDLDTALESIQVLREGYPGLSFDYWIIGDGPQYEALQARAFSLNIADCVTFLGAMGQEQRLEKLRQADVFLLTNISEGPAPEVLEASACALPAVVTNAGGLPELVVHDQTGFVSEIQHPAEIARHLAALLGNIDLRAQLGKASRQFVLEHHSAQILYPKMLAHYGIGV